MNNSLQQNRWFSFESLIKFFIKNSFKCLIIFSNSKFEQNALLKAYLLMWHPYGSKHAWRITL